MKTRALLLILFHCALSVVGQHDTLRVKGHTYLAIKQSVKNEFEGKDTLLKLYRLDHGVKTYLLSHFLYRYGGDCNNIFKDIGTMKCRGDSIIFETNYLQTGYDPIPEKEKQVYKVGANGKLSLLSDRIYWNGKWVNNKDISGKAP